MIGKYLAGTTASGLFEARLGHEEMGKENHVFSPAYRTEDIEELDRICDHIIFNSTAQLKKFKEEMCIRDRSRLRRFSQQPEL